MFQCSPARAVRARSLRPRLRGRPRARRGRSAEEPPRDLHHSCPPEEPTGPAGSLLRPHGILPPAPAGYSLLPGPGLPRSPSLPLLLPPLPPLPPQPHWAAPRRPRRAAHLPQVRRAGQGRLRSARSPSRQRLLGGTSTALPRPVPPFPVSRARSILRSFFPPQNRQVPQSPITAGAVKRGAGGATAARSSERRWRRGSRSRCCSCAWVSGAGTAAPAPRPPLLGPGHPRGAEGARWGEGRGREKCGTRLRKVPWVCRVGRAGVVAGKGDRRRNTAAPFL